MPSVKIHWDTTGVTSSFTVKKYLGINTKVAHWEVFQYDYSMTNVIKRKSSTHDNGPYSLNLEYNMIGLCSLLMPIFISLTSGK